MVETLVSTPSIAGGSTQFSGSTEASGSDALSSDFETFLKMLTVQVQNQDPLNPVDSTDYATQLATFSSVEQQVLTNDLLRSMAETLGGSSLQNMSGLIGMEALARAPVYFDQSGPISIRPELAEGANRAELVVRDESGAVIQRFDIPQGQESVIWAGGDDNGDLLPAGVYRFEIDSFNDETLVGSQLAQVYSRINEVRSDEGVTLVRLSDGSELPQSLITGLRHAN
ncbi:flagellar hook capping FlgD N-terminal domain-containing protein [Thalassococcus lentus]|uniref:Basal-body rod modification protein FlgD n=1 Tax=Thalassococcus lentus TaxID=1210524 RepID=A0ABT4XMZ5_9RHOB|nr:flagellar hook capping FlgD N-terminal domain-containing protein [Thalassococcus lentus]MDA7423314.1 flagellin biosynthesis protein FlgD [Thalassococcus lentus]